MTAPAAVAFGSPRGAGNVVRHHDVPDLPIDLAGVEGVQHVLVTACQGDVVGKLTRWVWDDGEVAYEMLIYGTEDDAGTCDVAAYTLETCRDLARVIDDIRYEWELLVGGPPRGD